MSLANGGTEAKKKEAKSAPPEAKVETPRASLLDYCSAEDGLHDGDDDREIINVEDVFQEMLDSAAPAAVPAGVVVLVNDLQDATDGGFQLAHSDLGAMYILCKGIANRLRTLSGRTVYNGKVQVALGGAVLPRDSRIALAANLKSIQYAARNVMYDVLDRKKKEAGGNWQDLAERLAAILKVFPSCFDGSQVERFDLKHGPVVAEGKAGLSRAREFTRSSFSRY